MYGPPPDFGQIGVLVGQPFLGFDAHCTASIALANTSRLSPAEPTMRP
jgi:hypothetical protein